MITVTEAKKRIEENTSLLSAVSISLEDAGGLILAENIVSGLDMPPFDQSAMDGYSFRFKDLEEHSTLQVIGAIPAGVPPLFKPAPGEAVRIFTGAPIPEGADTVVMQEKVSADGNWVSIADPGLKPGSNVRLRGSQTKKGEIALNAGAKLSPGAIGFLAGLGVEKVKVWSKPKVCLIITGKELAPPGSDLKPGQIYESNSFALTAALKELGITPLLVFRSDDDEAFITSCISTGIDQCDMVILTGGISIGEHDLVKKAMENCQVETVFYKVKQKPGKPLYFGRKDHALLFGLPGNPSAVLTCFYEYIVPAIKTMTGKITPVRSEIKKILAGDFMKKEGLTYFLKGKIQGDEVIPLNGQESYLMNSFASADCLILLEENKTEYRKGEVVEVHPLSRELFK